MEYKCQTVDMSRMIVSSKGFFTPICKSCTTQDCTNPIEKTKVSILGVIKEVQVYNRGTNPKFVIQCEGYMP